MAYQHSAYASEPTNAARLTKARLFLAELTDLITAATSRDGASRDPAPLLQLKQQVHDDIRRYEGSPVVQLTRMI